MHPEDLLRIDAQTDDGVTVLALHGEVDIATAGSLLQATVRAMRDTRLLLVDLRDVSLLDSTGVRALLQIRRRVSNHGGEAAFVSGRDGAGRTIELMGLWDVLGIHDDPAAALVALDAVG